MATIALDANTTLTPVIEPAATALSKALGVFIEKIFQMVPPTSTPATALAVRNTCRVFKKVGAPATNTAIDSPGQDMCFVIDTTNNDLYFISGWSAATTFVSTKILNGI